mgnify:FL=1
MNSYDKKNLKINLYKKNLISFFYIFSQNSNDKLTFFYTKNELHINDTYLIKSFTSYE